MNSFLILMGLFLYNGCQSGAVSQSPGSGKPAAAVKVTTNKKVYAADEKIVVTISNGLENPITTADQHTFCSVIILERKQEADWQPLKNCTLNAPSREITVQAHLVSTAELAPNPQSAGGIPAGTYRATLVYSVGEHFRPGQAHTVFSEPFSVR